MIINSILDTDTYKLTMQMSVAHQYPHTQVEYEFINRGNTPFPPDMMQELRREVDSMAELKLTNGEYETLKDICYYLKPNFLDMLRGYRFDPSQVNIRQVGNQLFITIKGSWYTNILWEVPLLAIISELYYKLTNQDPIENWKAVLTRKLQRFSANNVLVSDFGTRRRYSYAVHDHVVSEMDKHSCGTGTSNVHLAIKHGMLPIGTMAHEWIMAHAAMFGYETATTSMLKGWVHEYVGQLGVALPDTFTTDIFLRDFNTLYAKLFDGIRWDSGDWQQFTDKIVKHYKTLRIDPLSKIIVFSDGLNDDKAIEINDYCKGKIQARFGIGTFLTNDVGRTPLNIVIKMTKCNGRSTVKLSDSPGKETGTSEAVTYCKYALGLQ